ncbi:TIGR02117 family protein [Neisseria canis]|uniref:Protein of uncharacterized function (DUF2459) n=1 Tax=Neisseria canis TaxID=493 RepID=A0A1X3CVC9_9NEIS|nr:TIGR02117 family protein [Neisseria canis]OSI11371.1 hypothetical protein BWD07_09470 [Neisseria canis]VEE99861.1 Protein of uncharacterised function (DUF2459) [Neisseria canis]
MLRKMLRLLLKGLFTLLFLAGVYFASAWVLGRIPVNSGRAEQGDITIFLISNGVHTDIAMPLTNAEFDWRSVISPADTDNPRLAADYVALGWGDRTFYLDTPGWSDLTATTAFKALTGLSRTAVHATFSPKPQAGSRSIPIRVLPAEYLKLVNSILPQFQYRNGRAIAIAGRGYSSNDVFYEAQGRYSLFVTCNTWANTHLKNSGLKSVVWTPFSGAVMDVYRK